MSFALAAMACARRGAWVATGILIALAVLSQQFALLVAAPLLVLAPSGKRLSYMTAAVGTVVLAAVPLGVASSGSAVHAILFGTGDSGGVGGTILWELNLHGAPLVLLSRIAPVGLSVVISWWVVRRLGLEALEPAALIALVAVSLGLRLVFEQNLFGYYFMGLSVSLVLLDVARGRLRASVVAWVATVSMVFLIGSDSLRFLGRPWSTLVQDLISISVIILAILLTAMTIHRSGPTWRLAWWIGMLLLAAITWNETDYLSYLPTWFWQVVLVTPGIALAAGPLLAIVRGHVGRPENERTRALPRLP